MIQDVIQSNKLTFNCLMVVAMPFSQVIYKLNFGLKGTIAHRNEKFDFNSSSYKLYLSRSIICSC